MIQKIRRIAASFGVVALLGLAAAVVLPTDAFAKDYFAPGDGCTSSFLTFPAWYEGLPRDGCAIDQPSSGNNGGGIGVFVWRIVLNIIEIVLQAIGYIAAGFIIYGGFKYVTSVSSSDKTAAARKTILNAVIGLVISFMSVVIVTLIAGNIKP